MSTGKLLIHTSPPDPAEMGFPATLPLELAMKNASVRETCEAYGISKSEYTDLCNNPHFIAAVEAAINELAKEGVSFKLRAKAQAGELLRTSFALIHDLETPPSVKADLIKFTVRAAGLDASMDQKNQSQQVVVPLQINLNLGD